MIYNLSAFAVDTDGCEFRPSIQLKEYFLKDFVRETGIDHYEFFVRSKSLNFFFLY